MKYQFKKFIPSRKFINNFLVLFLFLSLLIFNSCNPQINVDSGQTKEDSPWKFMEFGSWPQSVKSEEVSINTSKIEKHNGWDCYKGSDGEFYVKARAKLFTGVDAYYTACKTNDPTEPGTCYKFDDGKTIIENGKEYYFKIEPIKWRILSPHYQGKKLLLAENILFPCGFYSCEIEQISRTDVGVEKPIYDNNYKYSEVRAALNGLSYYEINAYLEQVTNNKYLNKGFLQKAFTPEELKRIATVEIDNSDRSTSDYDKILPEAKGYGWESTQDKIFLLSLKELTDSHNLFCSPKIRDYARQKKATEYARTIGVWVNHFSINPLNGMWWTRSPLPIGDPNYGRTVHSDGVATNDQGVCVKDRGVVPALCLEN